MGRTLFILLLSSVVIAVLCKYGINSNLNDHRGYARLKRYLNNLVSKFKVHDERITKIKQKNHKYNNRAGRLSNEWNNLAYRNDMLVQHNDNKHLGYSSMDSQKDDTLHASSEFLRRSSIRNSDRDDFLKSFIDSEKNGKIPMLNRRESVESYKDKYLYLKALKNDELQDHSSILTSKALDSAHHYFVADQNAKKSLSTKFLSDEKEEEDVPMVNRRTASTRLDIPMLNREMISHSGGDREDGIPMLN